MLVGKHPGAPCSPDNIVGQGGECLQISASLIAFV